MRQKDPVARLTLAFRLIRLAICGVAFGVVLPMIVDPVRPGDTLNHVLFWAVFGLTLCINLDHPVREVLPPRSQLGPTALLVLMFTCVPLYYKLSTTGASISILLLLAANAILNMFLTRQAMAVWMAQQARMDTTGPS
jgi:hypothetical protein